VRILEVIDAKCKLNQRRIPAISRSAFETMQDDSIGIGTRQPLENRFFEYKTPPGLHRAAFNETADC